MRTKIVINPITGELDLIARIEYRQTEIDFGPSGKHESTFVIVDLFVNPKSIIHGDVAFASATLKEADEATMDALSLRFAAGDGQLTVFASALEGRVYGAFTINYSIS